jgi:anaerobic magnesium-protoporphyrin IX monomethyl ester cyclase
LKLTPPRPAVANLDELPWPDRDDIDYRAQRLPTASVLGGRGCPWRCSFCSIITFYEGNGTKGRRRRDPSKVVDELEYLHRERGVKVILWQDDDFLAGGNAAIRWAHAIANECVRRGLDAGLRWKISCRSDEISRESLEPLVAAGLTHVYMGVESGDPDDLKQFNKHLGPDKHLRAGEILRALGMSFDFGFMLFQPWSTIATVRNNLRFLREFAGDGATPISFCRTLPYAGTPLEERLKAEGRVRERDFHADYRFVDPRLDVFYDWTLSAFADRNHSASGTANVLRLLLFDAKLNLPQESVIQPQLADRIQQLSALSNQLLLDAAEMALDHVEGGGAVDASDETLATLESYHAREDARLREDLRALTRAPSAASADPQSPVAEHVG